MSICVKGGTGKLPTECHWQSTFILKLHFHFLSNLGKLLILSEPREFFISFRSSSCPPHFVLRTSRQHLIDIMSATSADPGGHCEQCSARTSKSCSGFSEATGMVVGADKTFYCGLICQKAGWEKHKSTCKSRKHTMSLYQAGDIIRHLWLIFRMQTYPAEIDSVKFEEEKITVWETSSAREWRYPGAFPHNLFPSDREREAFLGYMVCCDATENMRDLTRTLLSCEPSVLLAEAASNVATQVSATNSRKLESTSRTQR